MKNKILWIIVGIIIGILIYSFFQTGTPPGGGAATAGDNGVAGNAGNVGLIITLQV